MDLFPYQKKKKKEIQDSFIWKPVNNFYILEELISVLFQIRGKESVITENLRRVGYNLTPKKYISRLDH